MIVRKMTTSDKIYRVINYTFLTLLAFTTMYPFIYFLALSLNDGFDSMKGGIYFFPREFTLDNYVKAFKNPYIIDAFKISIMRTGLVTALSVFFTALLAYALSVKGWPGKKYFVFFFFFTTLFGGGLVPTFILYRQLHIYNTFWVLVLPAIYSFYNAVIIRTFFTGIPDSLPESARIDGASELGIFLKIMLPLSVPVLATIALFVGVGTWNDWFSGEFFVQNRSLQPASTLLNKIINEASFESAMGSSNSGSSVIQGNQALEQAKQTGTTPESLRMAFVIIIVTPIICVYPFVQRYFVKGVMVGSLKE